MSGMYHSMCRNVFFFIVSESGMQCEFLPPYSPDYNPIELAFSAVKAHLHRNYHEFTAAINLGNKMDIFSTLLDAVYSVTPEDISGWYHHCGYI